MMWHVRGKNRNPYRILVWICEGRRTLGRRKCRSKVHVKINLKHCMGRGGIEYTGFIWLRTGRNKNGNELWG
jgi:hypothetical protein